MSNEELLELIWSGSVEVPDDGSMSPLARLLDALLVVPMVALVSSRDYHGPVALSESSELLPGAPLGDVLAEELGTHVPHDAIVLIEPVEEAESTEVSGAYLGRELGNILLSLGAMPQDSVMERGEREGEGRISPPTSQHGFASAARQGPHLFNCTDSRGEDFGRLKTQIGQKIGVKRHPNIQV